MLAFVGRLGGRRAGVDMLAGRGNGGDAYARRRFVVF